MRTLRDPSEVNAIPADRLRALLAQRFVDLAGDAVFAPDEHGFLVVAEAGDSLTDLASVLGCPMIGSWLDDDLPDLVPNWEWAERHVLDGEVWFELVFVLSDSGFTVALFVPDVPGVDSRLLGLCRDSASVDVGLPPLSPSLAAQLSDLPLAAREWFQERAGILEYSADLSRGEAEERAFAEVTLRWPLASG